MPVTPTPHPTLIIATRNAHKVGEIRAILGEDFDYRTLADFPAAPPVVEDGATFAANAGKKAQGVASWLAGRSIFAPGTKVFVLADDSGLEVDALDGAPGVHSARFAALEKSTGGLAAAGNSSDTDNNAKLLRLLKDVPMPQRSARFRCVLALVSTNPESRIQNPVWFDGACAGRMDISSRGQGGFGYDPLFIPDGFDRSFAELGEAEKNKISHRSKALAKLSHWFAARAS